MMPLIEALYYIAQEDWNIAMGLLDREEYRKYQMCSRLCEEQRQRWERLQGDERAAWECYVANAEQLQDTECRLCFARGLAMGLGLGGFAAGE